MEIINNLIEYGTSHDYIDEIMRRLSHKLTQPYSLVAEEFFQDEYKSINGFPPTKYKKIGFITADEWNMIPPYIDNPNIHMIFKTSIKSDFQHPKLYPLPLGPFKGCAPGEYKKIEERSYDIVFNGQVQPHCNHRVIMANHLSNYIKMHPRSHVLRFVKKYRGGPIDEYASIMDETKIAIVPSGGGGVTCDSARYFDAMQAGCIILASPRPNVWFYDGAPHIEIDNWEKVGDLIDYIFKSKDHMQYLSERTLDWWNNVCCPEAVANYIANIINSKE